MTDPVQLAVVPAGEAPPTKPATRVDVPCTCQGTPHPEGDTVDLWPEATIDIGAAATVAVRTYGHDPVQLQVSLARAFVHYGIRAWSHVDARGNPVPVTPRDPDWPDVVDRYLPWARGGYEVAEAADDLYATDTLRPWLALSSKLSQPGQTAGPTSATQATGAPTPTPSRRSSRTSTGGKRSGARGR